VRTVVVVITLAVLALAAAPSFGDEGADRLIKRGDRFYANRGKGLKWCNKALEAYEKALALDPKCVEASWKHARAGYWLGTHTESDEKKLEIYKKGIDLVKRAVKIDEKSVACHFWLGVSYGKYGQAKGIMNSLALIDPIKKEFNRVIELDETFEGGGGHRALGWMYAKVPGVAGGSNEKAIEHLKKAIEIAKSRLLNHFFLASVYLDEGDDDKAREHLKFVVDAPFEDDRRPENEETKAKAKKLLEEMED